MFGNKRQERGLAKSISKSHTSSSTLGGSIAKGISDARGVRTSAGGPSVRGPSNSRSNPNIATRAWNSTITPASKSSPSSHLNKILSASKGPPSTTKAASTPKRRSAAISTPLAQDQPARHRAPSEQVEIVEYLEPYDDPIRPLDPRLSFAYNSEPSVASPGPSTTTASSRKTVSRTHYLNHPEIMPPSGRIPSKSASVSPPLNTDVEPPQEPPRSPIISTRSLTQSVSMSSAPPRRPQKRVLRSSSTSPVDPRATKRLNLNASLPTVALRAQEAAEHSDLHPVSDPNDGANTRLRDVFVIGDGMASAQRSDPVSRLQDKGRMGSSRPLRIISGAPSPIGELRRIPRSASLRKIEMRTSTPGSSKEQPIMILDSDEENESYVEIIAFVKRPRTAAALPAATTSHTNLESAVPRSPSFAPEEDGFVPDTQSQPPSSPFSTTSIQSPCSDQPHSVNHGDQSSFAAGCHQAVKTPAIPVVVSTKTMDYTPITPTSVETEDLQSAVFVSPKAAGHASRTDLDGHRRDAPVDFILPAAFAEPRQQPPNGMEHDLAEDTTEFSGTPTPEPELEAPKDDNGNVTHPKASVADCIDEVRRLVEDVRIRCLSDVEENIASEPIDTAPDGTDEESEPTVDVSRVTCEVAVDEPEEQAPTAAKTSLGHAQKNAYYNRPGIVCPRMDKRANKWTEWSSRLYPGSRADLIPALDKLYDGGKYRHVMRAVEEENIWPHDEMTDKQRLVMTIWNRWTQEIGPLPAVLRQAGWLVGLMDKYGPIMCFAEVQHEFNRQLFLLLEYEHINHTLFWNVNRYWVKIWDREQKRWEAVQGDAEAQGRLRREILGLDKPDELVGTQHGT